MGDNCAEDVYSTTCNPSMYDQVVTTENDYANYSDERFLKEIKDFVFPKAHHWVFLSLFLVVFIVGIVGNILVCYSVWKSRSLKTVTNFFLVNLSIADCLVILICLPGTVIADLMQSWFLGIAMCKINTYLQVGTTYCASFTNGKKTQLTVVDWVNRPLICVHVLVCSCSGLNNNFTIYVFLTLAVLPRTWD